MVQCAPLCRPAPRCLHCSDAPPLQLAAGAAPQAPPPPCAHLVGKEEVASPGPPPLEPQPGSFSAPPSP